MKRRHFLLVAAAATVAVTIPIVNYKCKHSWPSDPLLRPSVLARFCDESTIREIGSTYRQKFPSENTETRLRELLMSGNQGTMSDPALRTWLDEKIQHDFNASSTVIVNGWVLSQTEARQCALFSLT